MNDPRSNLDPLDVTPESANERSVPSPLQRAHRSARVSASLLVCAGTAVVSLGYLALHGRDAELLTSAYYASVPMWLLVLKLSLDYARLGAQSGRRWLVWLGIVWIVGGALVHWTSHQLLGDLPAARAMIGVQPLIETGHSDRFLSLFTAFVATARTATAVFLWVGAMGHFRDVALAVAARPGPAPWAWLLAVLGVRGAGTSREYRAARAWYLMPLVGATHAGTQGALDGFSGLAHLGWFDGWTPAEMQLTAATALVAFVLLLAIGLWTTAHRATVR